MAEQLQILVVDDQPRARKSLEALLSTWSRAVTIREAGNGREAVQLVDDLQPDLVLMDVRMPEMDGVEATAQIKVQWPQVKVVVLSIYAEHREEALAAGADAFVGKGDAPGTLLDVLSAVMQRGA
jgi:CheY-like chemotaxis protein